MACTLLSYLVYTEQQSVALHMLFGIGGMVVIRETPVLECSNCTELMIEDEVMKNVVMRYVA